MSSIYQHLDCGPGSPFARELGAELRRLRLARGMTQAHVAAPLSRAYLCAVERGRTLPSLGTLVHLSTRLGVSPQELLAGVNPPTGVV